MGSPEDRARHSRRLKRKKKERVRSVIAKELIVNKKYQMQVLKDRHGREVFSFRDLVEAIQDNDNE